MRQVDVEHRIDEMKEQNLTIGALRVEPLRVAIDEKTLETLNRVGDVTVTRELCVELERILGGYALFCQAAQVWEPDGRVTDELKRIRTAFDELIGALAGIDFKDVQLMGKADVKGKLSVKVQGIFWGAGVPPADFVGMLISLRDGTERLCKPRKPGRPPAYQNLLPFMTIIIPVYRAAGGSSVLVWGGEGRRSKFVDFVWVLLELLPPEMRYELLKALRAWWEDNAPAELRPRKRR